MRLPSPCSDARSLKYSTILEAGPVDTNSEWCAVVKTSLGSTRLILGGEVDCLSSAYDGRSLKNAVELKTNIVISNERDKRRFERSVRASDRLRRILGMLTPWAFSANCFGSGLSLFSLECPLVHSSGFS